MIRYTAHFNFREHLCISTELLGINLYELIKLNKFKGLPLKLVRHFTKQILEGLRFLDHKEIIHCDLKPENILLSDPDRGGIKIIDFGSSCYESERVYTYIQSRFYRSPEVILGMVYNQRIDMWSLGCIVAELLTGHPLFMGENEQEQIACIMEIFGVPEKSMISQCSRRKLFFDSVGNPRIHSSSKGVKRYPATKSLKKALKNSNEPLLDFISQCLIWNPRNRLVPYHGLHHVFIVGTADPSNSRKASYSSLNSTNSSKFPVLEATQSIGSIKSISSNGSGYLPKLPQPFGNKHTEPQRSSPLQQQVQQSRAIPHANVPIDNSAARLDSLVKPRSSGEATRTASMGNKYGQLGQVPTGPRSTAGAPSSSIEASAHRAISAGTQGYRPQGGAAQLEAANRSYHTMLHGNSTTKSGAAAAEVSYASTIPTTATGAGLNSAGQLQYPQGSAAHSSFAFSSSKSQSPVSMGLPKLHTSLSQKSHTGGTGGQGSTPRLG